MATTPVGNALRRREGAPHAGADRAPAAQPAAARRADQSPRHRDARSADRSAAGLRRRAGASSRTIATCCARRPTSCGWSPTAASRRSTATSTTIATGCCRAGGGRAKTPRGRRRRGAHHRPQGAKARGSAGTAATVRRAQAVSPEAVGAGKGDGSACRGKGGARRVARGRDAYADDAREALKAALARQGESRGRWRASSPSGWSRKRHSRGRTEQRRVDAACGRLKPAPQGSLPPWFRRAGSLQVRLSLTKLAQDFNPERRVDRADLDVDPAVGHARAGRLR